MNEAALEAVSELQNKNAVVQGGLAMLLQARQDLKADPKKIAAGRDALDKDMGYHHTATQAFRTQERACLRVDIGG